MAGFGEKRFKYNVMYLATIAPDSYPRVHPFTPFIGSGHLFAFMEPTSPKEKDLQRNRKYAMHSLVTDMNGSNGEFLIRGDAIILTDPSLREIAEESCPYSSFAPPQERQVLFEFLIESCLTNYYADGKSNAKHWRSGGDDESRSGSIGMKQHEDRKHEIWVDCEHCSKPFVIELTSPIAVRCSHCNAVFDARLQLEKKSNL